MGAFPRDDGPAKPGSGAGVGPVPPTRQPSRLGRIKDAVSGRLRRARQRWPLFDRVVTVASRYKDQGGDREAAALTYLGFLSLFPLILLSASVLGFVVRNAATVRQSIVRASERLIPGAAGPVAESVDAITRRATTIGVVALLGLVWTALGITGALRDALERIFEAPPKAGWRAKLKDLSLMAGLGLLLLLSVGLAALSAGALAAVMRHLGLTGFAVRASGVLVTTALTFGLQLLLFVVLFTAMPDHGRSWRSMLSGATVGAVGWTLLATLGGWYVSTSASRASAAYGVTAALLGLLLAINLSARVAFFAAHWAATRASGPCDAAP